MLTFTFRKKSGKNSIQLYHSGTPLGSMILQWNIDVDSRPGFDKSTLQLKTMNNIPAGMLWKGLMFDDFITFLRQLNDNPINSKIWYSNYETLLFVESKNKAEVLDFIQTYWVPKDENDIAPIVELSSTEQYNNRLIEILVFNKNLDQVQYSVNTKELTKAESISNELESLLALDVEQLFSSSETLKHPSKKKVETINKRRISEYESIEAAKLLELNPELKRNQLTIDTSSVELVSQNDVWELPKNIQDILKSFSQNTKQLYLDNNDLKSQITVLKDTVLSDSNHTGELQLKISELNNQLTGNTNDTDDAIKDFLLKENPLLLANPTQALNMIYQWMQLNTQSYTWFTTVTQSNQKNQLKLIQKTIELALVEE